MKNRYRLKYHRKLSRFLDIGVAINEIYEKLVVFSQFGQMNDDSSCMLTLN